MGRALRVEGEAREADLIEREPAGSRHGHPFLSGRIAHHETNCRLISALLESTQEEAIAAVQQENILSTAASGIEGEGCVDEGTSFPKRFGNKDANMMGSGQHCFSF